MGIVSKKLSKFSENSRSSKISLAKTIANSKDLVVPSYIFTDRRLTPLSAVIKYLREKRGLSFHLISSLLQRHVRDIHKAYSHSLDLTENVIDEVKQDFDNLAKPTVEVSQVEFIPLSIISNRRISALEAIVVYLKDQREMSYTEISLILNRNQRTVWTVYARAKTKQ